MKQISVSLTATKCILWVALCATLFSFSDMGGDSYSIYLNKKAVVQEYVTRQASVPQVSLDQISANDEFQIYYSHCGQIGKSRSITIRDEQHTLLKEWRFADASGDDHSAMTVKTAEILALHQKGNKKIKLVYSSNELPEGRLLAYVLFKDTNAVGLR